jgi:hypothetical protein
MSSEHEKAMDYIYDREVEEDEPHKVRWQFDECNRLVNLYDEPIFIMRVMYHSTGAEFQQRWCRHCVVKWSKRKEK